MGAHRYAAYRRQHDGGEQQSIDDHRDDPIGVILSFEKSSIPLAVENVVYDQEHRHSDAEPLVQGLSRYLIRHEAKQEDGHDSIHDPLYDHILICLGHGAVPPSPGLFQAVDPGLKICFRDVSAEALALQPGSCTCKSLHVGAASADAASA